MSSTNPNKRQASNSPEITVENEIVGKMAVRDLIGLINQSLDEKLKALPSKDDIQQISNKVEDVSEKIDVLSAENQILQDKIKALEEDKEKTERRMLLLEDAVKKKSIIIKGLKSQKSLYKAVDNLFKNKLKISSRVEIESIKKLYDGDEKMAVVVEVGSERMVSEVFKHTKNLAGSNIFIENDLNSKRQQTKKVMLQLKKEILAVSKSKRILIRSDKMRVGEKWFYFNKENVLVCNNESGEDTLKEFYGDSSSQIDILYDSLLSKINSKN